MNAAEAGLLALYYAVLGTLAVYSIHRLHLVRLRDRSARPELPQAAVYPQLAVQLPLFNEPDVAARLLDAVARLEYPGRLEIQVLDDSDDETTAVVAESIPKLRERGLEVMHVRRGSRDGFKAGALAYGMAITQAELFAVLDADFVPHPDLLLKIVPHFADASVGMVQARWTHLNRDESLLTRVQALFLDAHFAVESAARNFSGRFFNFNGTAGVWRREAIESAGGWSAATLTEDLDLSYRAQLAGWKFVFLDEVEVPAELPAAWHGFQNQQHRWAKGSIQTGRRLLPAIHRSSCDQRIKAEAFFHLTNNSAYLLTVVLALLLVPVMLTRQRHGLTPMIAVDAVLFAVSSASVLLFYRQGQVRAGQPLPSWRHLLAVLPVGIAMSVRNAVAVIEGLAADGGEFRRTPKRGTSSRPSERGELRITNLAEVALAFFFCVAICAFAGAGLWTTLPFLCVFASGYAYAAISALVSGT
jgi:cellulose synthase/poly-beta-1,6-N-acetylglucosamine synthase-like glycosyltransferase